MTRRARPPVPVPPVPQVPGDVVVEIDAMDVVEWEHGQRTPQASDANLAALLKETARTGPAGSRAPAQGPRLGTEAQRPPGLVPRARTSGSVVPQAGPVVAASGSVAPPPEARQRGEAVARPGRAVPGPSVPMPMPMSTAPTTAGASRERGAFAAESAPQIRVTPLPSAAATPRVTPMAMATTPMATTPPTTGASVERGPFTAESAPQIRATPLPNAAVTPRTTPMPDGRVQAPLVGDATAPLRPPVAAAAVDRRGPRGSAAPTAPIETQTAVPLPLPAPAESSRIDASGAQAVRPSAPPSAMAERGHGPAADLQRLDERSAQRSVSELAAAPAASAQRSASSPRQPAPRRRFIWIGGAAAIALGAVVAIAVTAGEPRSPGGDPGGTTPVVRGPDTSTAPGPPAAPQPGAAAATASSATASPASAAATPDASDAAAAAGASEAHAAAAGPGSPGAQDTPDDETQSSAASVDRTRSPHRRLATAAPHNQQLTRRFGKKKLVVDYSARPTDAPTPGLIAQAAEDPAIGLARNAYMSGNQRLFTGNLGGAIGAYRLALRLYPGYVGGYRGLGLAYEQRGDAANALEAFQTYVAAVPNAKDVELIKKRIARLQAGGR